MSGPACCGCGWCESDSDAGRRPIPASEWRRRALRDLRRARTVHRSRFWIQAAEIRGAVRRVSLIGWQEMIPCIEAFASLHLHVRNYPF